MAEQLNSFSITGVAQALTQAMGIEKPHSANPAIAQLVNLVKNNARSGKADRVFMYNPDAIGMWLYQKYTAWFDAVAAHTQLALPLCTVMPSVTPVCFGSLYTGALPEVHGIRRYEKPVLRTDTLFDAALRAGKKVAILAETDCSIAKIFLEREADYFIYDSIDEITEKALQLIDADEYDLIAVYHGNYDAIMHKNGPEAEVSLNALKANIAVFDTFAQAIKEKWTQHDTLIGFAMDHGCHEIDGNCGSHGLDMPEDLNILHLYGVFPAQK